MNLRRRPPTDLQSVPFGHSGTPPRNFTWSWRWDLNPQPADYKSAALPIELRQPSKEGVPYPGPRQKASVFSGLLAGRKWSSRRAHEGVHLNLDQRGLSSEMCPPLHFSRNSSQPPAPSPIYSQGGQAKEWTGPLFSQKFFRPPGPGQTRGFTEAKPTLEYISTFSRDATPPEYFCFFLAHRFDFQICPAVRPKLKGPLPVAK